MSDSYIDPSPVTFAAFKALPRDMPIEMLNLLRYRDVAAYPADHAQAQNTLTGAQAYQLYSTDSVAVFSRVGGTIVYAGKPQCVVIGPDDERWDAMFIARYPHAGAFLAMVTDPLYRLAVVHRQAAVLTSRLVRLSPRAAGSGFVG